MIFFSYLQVCKKKCKQYYKNVNVADLFCFPPFSLKIKGHVLFITFLQTKVNENWFEMNYQNVYFVRSLFKTILY